MKTLCLIVENKNRHKETLSVQTEPLEGGDTERVKRKEDIGVYPGPVVSISINIIPVLLDQ